ncbi:MAG TPA: DMT family transporter [Alphaproteobacteria bacterium]
MSFPPPTAPSDRPLRGITYMLLGIGAFSLTDALAKWIVAAAPIPEVVAIRNGFTLLLILPAVIRAGGLRALATQRGGAHATRALLSVGALLTFFEALRQLPLATCIAIGFAAPLFMTVASVVMLREHVGVHRWAAIGVGFVGVLIIAWPDAGGFLSWPAVLMLLSSLCFALAMTSVRWLARTESDVAMLFYQNTGMLAAGLVGSPFVWQPPTAIEVGVMAAMAVALAIGQVFTIRAFREAPVGVVAPFEYTELLWAALIGYFVWNELPGSHVWAGAGIVVLSGLYIIWREALAARRRAAAAVPIPAASAPVLSP